jgi:hypothetical protein
MGTPPTKEPDPDLGRVSSTTAATRRPTSQPAELRIRHWPAVYGRAMGLDGEPARGHDATEGGGPP